MLCPEIGSFGVVWSSGSGAVGDTTRLYLLNKKNTNHMVELQRRGSPWVHRCESTRLVGWFTGKPEKSHDLCGYPLFDDPHTGVHTHTNTGVPHRVPEVKAVQLHFVPGSMAAETWSARLAVVHKFNSLCSVSGCWNECNKRHGRTTWANVLPSTEQVGNPTQIIMVSDWFT